MGAIVLTSTLSTRNIKHATGSVLFEETIVRPDVIVHSGISELDVLLGGFKAGEITLIDGTSDLVLDLPHQLCVNTYRTFQSDTVYLDGGVCADPYRIARYARMMELDQREVLAHVHVSRAFTVYQLSMLVHEMLEPLICRWHPRTLLIGMFPALYGDPDVPSREAQVLLKNNVKKIQELTTTYDLITVLTSSDRFLSSTRRNLRNCLYSFSDEIVRMRQDDQCIFVDLVKRQQKTTIIRCARGQLRLEAFGLVI